MENDSDVARPLIVHVLDLIEPLGVLSGDQEALNDLLQRLGWNPDALGIDLPSIVGSAVGELQNASAALGDLLDQDSFSLFDLAEALAPLAVAAGGVIGAIAAMPSPASLPPDLPAQLAEDLVGFLAAQYLNTKLPQLSLALQLVGVVKTIDRPALAASDGTMLRTAVRQWRLDIAALPQAFSDPIGFLRDQYFKDAQGAWRVATTVADALGPPLADALLDAGLSAAYGTVPILPNVTFTSGQLAAVDRLLLIDVVLSDAQPQTRARFVVGLVDDQLATHGPGILLGTSGDVSYSLVLPGGTLTADAAGAAAPIVVTKDGIAPASGSVIPTVVLSLKYDTGSGGKPAFRIGPADGSNFKTDALAVSASVTLGAQGVDVGGSFDASGVALSLKGGDGDGFLAQMLPEKPIVLGGDIGVDWSTRTGVRVHGDAAIEIHIGNGQKLGPIELVEFIVALKLTDDHVALEVTLTLALDLGPLHATVQQIGLRGSLVPVVPPQSGTFGNLDLQLGLRPPSGIAASVAAGPVSGGGYLYFDFDKQQYAGALQLSIQTINLVAIGVLTTKLPDGSAGFSLLVIITAEFPPIQLGYGFVLTGVGGLLGINRMMAVEPLRDGIRHNGLNSILFPQDPLAHITKVISDINTIFPPAERRFVFGPMVKLGWGPNALLDIEAAVVLDLPSPLRLAILGRLRVALPTKTNAIVAIELDMAGILDFDRSEASVDASLVNSQIATFPITGDMSMRLAWGATKVFALAAGGFHPRFTPPAGFPVLGRLAIALASGDNPTIRLESYFALTANSVQFGARADIRAKTDTFVGRFSVAAYIAFDTLIQFNPFHLQAELGAGVDVMRDGNPVVHAQLSASLTGPSPWHAAGFAEFQVGIKVRVAFETTVGQPAAEQPQVVDLMTMLRTEIARADSWAAVPSSDAGSLASLRAPAPGAGIIVHPLGAIALHQRLLPFGKQIARFGAALPLGGPQQFVLNAIRVGSGSPPPAALFDDFAPGQYDVLTDDEKLARPAFESMQAGGTVPVSGLAIPKPAAAGSPVGVLVDIGYDEAVIDATTSPSAKLPARTIPLSEQVRLLELRRSTGLTAAPPDVAIGVLAERYVVSHADSLQAVGEPGDGTSAAQAHDARRTLMSSGTVGVTVVRVAEAA